MAEAISGQFRLDIGLENVASIIIRLYRRLSVTLKWCCFTRKEPLLTNFRQQTQITTHPYNVNRAAVDQIDIFQGLDIYTIIDNMLIIERTSRKGSRSRGPAAA